MTLTSFSRLLLSIPAVVAAPLALAHGGLTEHAHAAESRAFDVAIQAAAHPMTGWDHLLAALLVGLLALGLAGQRRAWVPVVFVLGCVAGLVAAQSGALALPVWGLELGVALSLVALGAALALAMSAKRADGQRGQATAVAGIVTVLVLVAAAGITHGLVHGLELAPAAGMAFAQTLPALAGLVLATAGLHALAWWLGAQMLARNAGLAAALLRGAGAAAAVAGGLQAVSLVGL